LLLKKTLASWTIAAQAVANGSTVWDKRRASLRGRRFAQCRDRSQAEKKFLPKAEAHFTPPFQSQGLLSP
jgi:hypothetical protein